MSKKTELLAQKAVLERLQVRNAKILKDLRADLSRVLPQGHAYCGGRVDGALLVFEAVRQLIFEVQSGLDSLPGACSSLPRHGDSVDGCLFWTDGSGASHSLGGFF